MFDLSDPQQLRHGRGCKRGTAFPPSCSPLCAPLIALYASSLLLPALRFAQGDDGADDPLSEEEKVEQPLFESFGTQAVFKEPLRFTSDVVKVYSPSSEV